MSRKSPSKDDSRKRKREAVGIAVSGSCGIGAVEGALDLDKQSTLELDESIRLNEMELSSMLERRKQLTQEIENTR